jgi:hypothetical protein
MPVTAIAAGIGLVGGIGKMIGRGKANRQMRDLLASQPKYKYDEMARTLLNARMPGAAQAERNIYQGGANTMGRMQQAATSSADLMQAAAGTQAQENQAFQGLAGQEAQDYQRRYGNYQEEQQRKFADELRQYQTRSQLEGAIQENKQNTWGDIANMGFGLASFNAQGGFGDKGLKGLFGKSGGGGVNQANAVANMSKMGYPRMTSPTNTGAMQGAYNPIALSNMANMGQPQMGNYGNIGMIPNANNPYYYQSQALMQPQYPTYE